MFMQGPCASMPQSIAQTCCFRCSRHATEEYKGTSSLSALCNLLPQVQEVHKGSLIRLRCVNSSLPSTTLAARSDSIVGK